MAEYVPPLGSSSDDVFVGNVKRLDELVNSEEVTVPDRAGVDLDTWRGMMAKNDEVRQNIIPLSKQYMTLEAAQADIANIPEGSTTYYRSPDDSALAVEVMNVGGTLEATGRAMPSQDAVNKISNLIGNGEQAADVYFTTVDKNGLSGEGFNCRRSDNSFGAADNRISDDGIRTQVVDITHSNSGEPILAVDKNGLGFVPGVSAVGGGSSDVSDDVIKGSLKSESGLVDIWNFANKDDYAVGKKSLTKLTVTGTPANWPNNISLKGGASWLTLPFTDDSLYTIKIVFQLPYISSADTGKARGVVYSFDSSTTQGARIHIQADESGVYTLYAFKPESGFLYAGVVLPADFKAGDWLCMHHVVSRDNTGNNHQCIFLGERYTRWVEPEYTKNTPVTAYLNIGATGIDYSAGYNYAYCDLNIAECAYYNIALSEAALRDSLSSTKNRMSNLGISIKGY